MTNTKKRQKYKHKDKYEDRYTHTDTGKKPNTQSRKDPNAKTQMSLFRLPGFWGQSSTTEKIDISASGGPF